MNVLILKLIALSTMIIDHYGVIFHNDIAIYRSIGRIAFPLYCFLLVEGYFHTSNVKNYAKRLFAFALISEIPFDLAFNGKLELGHQNVFFTLLIGLAVMYLLDNKEAKYNYSKTTILLVASLLTIVFSVDYSFIGIIYILAFYYTRELPSDQRILRVAFIIFLTNLVFYSLIQQFSLLAFPLIYVYNGRPGTKNRVMQMMFYIAYPMHLALFYIINIL